MVNACLTSDLLSDKMSRSQPDTAAALACAMPEKAVPGALLSPVDDEIGPGEEGVWRRSGRNSRPPRYHRR